MMAVVAAHAAAVFVLAQFRVVSDPGLDARLLLRHPAPIGEALGRVAEGCADEGRCEDRAADERPEHRLFWLVPCPPAQPLAGSFADASSNAICTFCL